MTGFGAVPDELQAAAKKIGDTVGQATDCGWNGPSGDYGHPGVMSGWEQFIRDMEKHIKDLVGKAEDFGTGLFDAAREYLETDDKAGVDFGKVGEGLGTGVGMGIMNPEVAKRLNPDWTPPPPGRFPIGDEGPIF